MATLPEIGQEPDALVPDPQCRRECGGISPMTWWRLEFGRPDQDKPPVPNFPPRYRINNRNYRRRRHLERFKETLKVES